MKVSRHQGPEGPYTVIEVDGISYNLTELVRRHSAFTGKTVGQDVSPMSLLHRDRFTVEWFREVIEGARKRGELTVLEGPVGALLCPLPSPGKIIGIGWNYAKHAAEGGFEPPDEPVYFSKSPGVVVGPDDDVVLPGGIGRIDPEAEIAVIIGKRAKSVDPENALSFVGGYTCFNDVTAREMQRADQAEKRPWFRSKSIDTFGPLGPCIVTPDEFGWPPVVDVEMRVNGEVRQQESTEHMIFTIPKLIAAVTRWITLEPGDVIATGTPDGIAPVHPGDEMVVSVSGIGELRNRCVAEKTE